MQPTVLSLQEIYSNLEASIAELGALEPELASRIKKSVSRAFAENERMKADKLYREMKRSYY
ncbi:MAG: hypothetical protein H6Q14_131 [Bacteroidetes bacterium]|nr:hypothetical protein [Bacteroidota bacterium]